MTRTRDSQKKKGGLAGVMQEEVLMQEFAERLVTFRKHAEKILLVKKILALKRKER